MAAYRRVYDPRLLQADCQEPGSAPELYARYSSMGYLYLFYCQQSFLLWLYCVIIAPDSHRSSILIQSCRVSVDVGLVATGSLLLSRCLTTVDLHASIRAIGTAHLLSMEFVRHKGSACTIQRLYCDPRIDASLLLLLLFSALNYWISQLTDSL